MLEVEFQDDQVIVRNSNFKTELSFTPDEWGEFIAGAKIGQFDFPEIDEPEPAITTPTATRLHFTFPPIRTVNWGGHEWIVNE